MGRKNHCIRSGLVSDREHQPTHKRRIQREAFGVYRPLTKESAENLQEALLGAHEDISEYLKKLYRRNPPKIKTQDELGVTFVARTGVRKSMALGLLQRGFELGRMTQKIESHEALQPADLEVPLSHLDWFGVKGRRLVGCFAESEGLDELTEQSVAVHGVLSQVRGAGIKVHVPDHVSMFRRIGGGSELSYHAREEVERIVGGHLLAANIDSVTLDGLVIGDSYTKSRTV